MDATIDFDELILALREIVQNDPNRPQWLHKLGIVLSDRYKARKATEDLDEAIQVTREAIDTGLEDDDKPGWREDLSILLEDRFTRTREMTDIEEALQLTRNALETTSVDDAKRPELLHRVGKLLKERYLLTKSAADISEAIRVTKEAADSTLNEDSEKAEWLNSLGMRLFDRFLATRTTKDLEDGIESIKDAIKRVPENYEGRDGWLLNLGELLRHRSLQTKSTNDIEEAVRVTREGIRMTPKNHPDIAKRLNHFQCLLGEQYLRTNEIMDLDESIQAARDALDVNLENHAERAGWLNNLGMRLGDRHKRTHQKGDIEEAIRVTREAIRITPEDNIERAHWMSSLATHLYYQIATTGVSASEHLEEVIKVTQDAVNLTPLDDSNRAQFLSNLGVFLGERYLQTKTLGDIEAAVRVSREAITTTPDDHPSLPKRLHNLARLLGDRFTRTGAIEEGILGNGVLWNGMMGRHPRTRAMEDLDEAIRLSRRAENIIPKDHLDRPDYLNNLSVRLYTRGMVKGDPLDLEDAMDFMLAAVHSTSNNSLDRLGYLNNLSFQLGERYLRKRDMEDLEQAISLSKEVINSAKADDHPDRATWLNNLADRLRDRYEETRLIPDLEEAVVCNQAALRQTNARIIPRIFAGKMALHSCVELSRWEDAFEESKIALDLIPKLASRYLETSDKQHVLSQMTGLACDATAVALQIGKPPLLALNILEQGRGVLATSLNESQEDIVDLQLRHPKMADDFVRLSDELSSLGLHRGSLSGSGAVLDESILDTHPLRDRSLVASGLDNIITEIRKQPGFHRFLCPPNEQQMRSAAQHGPIAVLNISEYRCDALLIETHQLTSLPLPDLTIDALRVKSNQGSLGDSQCLAWLWDTIADPILKALDITKCPSGNEWPRIWWVLTGALTKFPLHAAGYHARGTGETVIDRVVSSYSLSLNAIIKDRNRRPQHDADLHVQKALLISMETTRNADSLQYAKPEKEALKPLCEAMGLVPVEPGARKEDIIEHLPSCKIFHFAGHGKADDIDPSQSYVSLDDWETNPFTVADLLELRLHRHSPFLAYLSACRTGEIRDDRFFDESIHLISAFQLAGFRHVIGTLWEVNDESCVDMARITYEEIVSKCMADGAVSMGLHKAARELRDRSVFGPNGKKRAAVSSRHSKVRIVEKRSEAVGGCVKPQLRAERKITLDDSEEEEQSANFWVPYVHFGI